jgi:hypothetical protein
MHQSAVVAECPSRRCIRAVAAAESRTAHATAGTRVHNAGMPTKRTAKAPIDLASRLAPFFPPPVAHLVAQDSNAIDEASDRD